MFTKQISFFIILSKYTVAIILIALCGCQSTLTLYEQDLTLITSASQMTDLKEAFRNKSDGLIQAIDQSLEWFSTPSSKTIYAKLNSLATHENARQSLITFRKLLLQSKDAESFARSTLSQFNIYQSAGSDKRGNVLFTGYFAPEYLASRVLSEQFKYPLYELPENFYEYRDSSSPTRYEIESSKLFGGHEIAWLKDPLSVYLIHVNGSAKLRLQDGSQMCVSYTATNYLEYTSLGKLLIAAGLSDPDEMSMQKIREIYDHSQKIVEELMLENDRFVFFCEASDKNWPSGSIGIALTPQASLAMDQLIFPPAGIFLVDTQIEDANESPSRYVRVMINQDTGGAIKGPGRADIYMGVGKQAGDIAGKLKSHGKLFYFLLKRN